MSKQMKKCSRCKEEKALVEFGKDKSKQDGINIYCKVCVNETSSVYRKNNKNKRKETVKRWKQNNKDKVSAISKKWKQNNKDKVSARWKEYYDKNKEQLNEKSKTWRDKNKDRAKDLFSEWYKNNIEHEKNRRREWAKNNQERIREYRRRRRATKKSLNEIYSGRDEKYTKNLFNNKCFNCGSTERLEIDHHYPLSNLNKLTRQNAVLLCKSCNCSKGNKMPEDFYSIKQIDLLLLLGVGVKK